ncbi:MAG: hypothetical protein IKF17_00400 [Clostridia bacterium]|nr:hypothetical protein [Clostridia bacterium]
MMELDALNKTIKNGTMYHLLDASPMGNSYYKLTISIPNYRENILAYAYVSVTKNTSMVFIYEPNSKYEPYMAFWLCDGKVTRLIKNKTLGYAKRIISQIVIIV